ncbi:MAG: class I SAM-dependent methyltransferase [Bacteroidales bacterium]|jgi:ubiquinone/menaquinone biosynthesis C-methylase UbiE|nr:class I SAM-dependent methyltransferase [Bacteroidales bacterium]
MKKFICGNDVDKMPGWAFRIMAFMFNIADFFLSAAKRLDRFNIQNGQIVIDYGSGTGRYLPGASAMVGSNGMVYAVDIHELAIRSAFRIIEKQKLKNVKPVLTDGKSVNIPSGTADIIYALDMFHMVRDTTPFLKELHRLAKPGGILYIEDGHQPRSSTLDKILKSGYWNIISEQKSFVTCKPKTQPI